MALEPCRECGKEVSTEATSCPHCGVGSPTAEPGKANARNVLLIAGTVRWISEEGPLRRDSVKADFLVPTSRVVVRASEARVVVRASEAKEAADQGYVEFFDNRLSVRVTATGRTALQRNREIQEELRNRVELILPEEAE